MYLFIINVFIITPQGARHDNVMPLELFKYYNNTQHSNSYQITIIFVIDSDFHQSMSMDISYQRMMVLPHYRNKGRVRIPQFPAVSLGAQQVIE